MRQRHFKIIQRNCDNDTGEERRSEDRRNEKRGEQSRVDRLSFVKLEILSFNLIFFKCYKKCYNITCSVLKKKNINKDGNIACYAGNAAADTK